MKLKQWLYGATALAMLAACSERDIAPDSGGGNPENLRDGYIGINIKLPSTQSTRGEYTSGNDNFDDGVDSEYEINDAVLVLFQGNTVDANGTKVESTEDPNYDEAISMKMAKYLGAFTLRNSAAFEDVSEDNFQVTKHVTRVANVSGIDKTKLLFALVMINGKNGNDIFSSSVDEPAPSWMNETLTIADFQEKVIENSLYTQKDGPGSGYASNIFMTNSPLSSVKGGHNNPQTITNALPVLVKLDPTTYDTEGEALNNPAATINVERAVGKITCSKFSKTTTGKDGGKLTLKYVNGSNEYEYELTVSSVKWGIAQDMANTFLVRNTNRKRSGENNNLWTWSLNASGASDAASGQYRMIGDYALINKDGSEWYRPYFCRVPGYGIQKTIPDPNKTDDSVINVPNREDKTFVHTTVADADAVELVNGLGNTSFVSDGAFYPRENTFPVEFMKYANTTRVGFWVTFEFKATGTNAASAPNINNGANFYIKGADKSTIYLDDKTYGKDPLTVAAISELSNYEKYTEIETALKNALEEGKTDVGSISGFRLGDCLDIDYDENLLATSGKIVITGIKFKTDTNDPCYKGVFETVPSYTFSSSLIASLNGLGEYYKYDGGKVFYEVRIKHFGDDLTPWDAGNGVASTITEAYGPENTRNANYLGRYGIVRNNWYDLQVNTITKLGDPEDPALWDTNWPGKPDDNKDQYIAVILHVLSWAKRTQQVDF